MPAYLTPHNSATENDSNTATTVPAIPTAAEAVPLRVFDKVDR
ncbi:hypothetical protein HSR122_0638 [Halapricum desulfuricans]|uniref:Uncharacterized protein n=1 Tax=Halapricum desulfuricans TaxID=2841257 RepID=A0A897N634_9EURY|nr:hypothetical protein HSR122_0638 [Halapricum desulfuricans]